MSHQKPAIISAPAAVKPFAVPQQQGFALLVVLWIVSIMLMISAALLYSVKTENAMTHYRRDTAIIRAYADAALRYSINQLLLEPALRDINIIDKTFTWAFEESEAEITIMAETGLIDLNRAPRTLLQKLFVHLGLEEELQNTLLDNIADFKDKDQLVRLNGAEDSDYIEAGFLYGAKDAPFERIEELQQVMEITPQLYNKFEKYLTVSSQAKGINPMLAPRHILMLLADGDESLVQDYMEQRESNEGAHVQPTFGQGFISYKQQARYRIKIKVTLMDETSHYLEERSIRLVKDKIPPFTSYFRKRIQAQ